MHVSARAETTWRGVAVASKVRDRIFRKGSQPDRLPEAELNGLLDKETPSALHAGVFSCCYCFASKRSDVLKNLFDRNFYIHALQTERASRIQVGEHPSSFSTCTIDLHSPAFRIDQQILA